jgi:lipopolysaccharide export system ATP-binding protein
LGVRLRAEGLQKTYGKRRVVEGVSLYLEPGEIVGLLGPNGAGKTTTFYMIVGFIRPDAGDIYLGEERLTALPMYRRAQRGIGYLPQEASVFRRMSVEDNIRTVLELRRELSSKQIRERIEALLEEFGLTHVRKSLGQQLSGGERRRTEIARALATEPHYLLLDEPFAGVDPIAVEEIQQIVLKLAARGIGILITDHNVHETLGITQRAYLLYEGRILKEGTAEELAADPQVRKVYLGERFQLIR